MRLWKNINRTSRRHGCSGLQPRLRWALQPPLNLLSSASQPAPCTAAGIYNITLITHGPCAVVAIYNTTWMIYGSCTEQRRYNSITLITHGPCTAAIQNGLNSYRLPSSSDTLSRVNYFCKCVIKEWTLQPQAEKNRKNNMPSPIFVIILEELSATTLLKDQTMTTYLFYKSCAISASAM